MIQPIKPNPIGMFLAENLRKAKDVLNYPGKLPVVGGAGDILFGEAPEALEDYAHGFRPYRGSGWAFKLDPRLIDVFMLPGVATLVAGLRKGGAKVASASSTQADPARRRLVAAAAAAPVAAAAAIRASPEMLAKLLRETASLRAMEKAMVPEAVSAATKAAVRGLTAGGVSKLIGKIGRAFGGDEAFDVLNPSIVDQELVQRLSKNFADDAEFERFLDNLGEWNPHISATKRWGNPDPATLAEVQSAPGDMLFDILKSGNLPKEWASKGINFDHVADALNYSENPKFIQLVEDLQAAGKRASDKTPFSKWVKDD